DENNPPGGSGLIHKKLSFQLRRIWGEPPLCQPIAGRQSLRHDVFMQIVMARYITGEGRNID
ncbi:MAG: hypothetical protein ACLFUP_09315, partial [Desulfobacteraceae bacterium]